MRLQRALARAGVASRRAAEDLIRRGDVRVNGEVATIGAVVDPDQDDIRVGRRKVERPPETAWILVHKPVGYITTRRDPEGRPTVFDLVPDVSGLTYVGRLDVMTEGLLLLTNDGAAANLLTHPRYAVDRTYRADVTGVTPAAVRKALDKGVVIHGRPVAVRHYEVRKQDRGVRLLLTLTEGRNRIVRKLCDAMGARVKRLVRLSHGPIRLGSLPAGEWRYLTPAEVGRITRLVSQ